MNPTARRKQVARTCKKFGLLVQPNAMQILIQEMEKRSHDNFVNLLKVLQTKLARVS